MKKFMKRVVQYAKLEKAYLVKRFGKDGLQAVSGIVFGAIAICAVLVWLGITEVQIRTAKAEPYITIENGSAELGGMLVYTEDEFIVHKGATLKQLYLDNGWGVGFVSYADWLVLFDKLNDTRTPNSVYAGRTYIIPHYVPLAQPIKAGEEVTR